MDHAFEPQLGSSIMEEEDVVEVEVEASKTMGIAGATDAADGKLPGVSTPATKEPCRGHPQYSRKFQGASGKAFITRS